MRRRVQSNGSNNALHFKYSLIAVAITLTVRLLTYHYLLTIADEPNNNPTGTGLDLNDDPTVDTIGIQRYKETDHSSVVPLRDESTKIISQACVRSGYGGVYLKHFRKAGGTSLMTGLQEAGICVRRQPQTPFFGNEYPYFNNRTFVALGTSVFITSMRHPIDRILSMYWFEGRWPRTCGKLCEDKKLKNNDTKVADLDEWIEAIHDQSNREKLNYRRHTSCGQWMSVDNYYIRTLLGIDSAVTPKERKSTKNGMGFFNKTITREHLHRAKEILASFDLVMIQEQMKSKDTSMVEMFYSITGMRTEKKEIPHSRGASQKELEERENTPSSRYAIDRLREWNALDIELYNYAVVLSKQSVDWWVASGKKEQENVMNNAFNPIKSCKRPPLELDGDLLKTVLGGNGCKHIVRKMIGGRCFQHSNEQVRP